MGSKFNTELLKRPVSGAGILQEDTIDKFKSTSSILKKVDSQVDMLPSDTLLPYQGHPEVRDTEKLQELAESIAAHGILTPLQVRIHPTLRGSYEILAGHHRKRAGDMVGIAEYPCIIKTADDDTAALIVTESNKQNGFDDMLPSEIAWALKIEYEALKHQGNRADLLEKFEEKNETNPDEYEVYSTCGTVCHKLNSRDQVADNSNMSSRSISNYLRLSELLPELLKMVDNSVLKATPALPLRAGVSLSYLKSGCQLLILEAIRQGYKVDMKKAEQLRERAGHGQLDAAAVENILSGENQQKKKNITAVKLPLKKLRSYFPASLPASEYETYILRALAAYREREEGSGS